MKSPIDARASAHVRSDFEETRVNRMHLLLLALTVTLVGACAPQSQVEQNVIPWLVSASRTDSSVVLQGHYFSFPRAAAEESYVLLGADANGNGGVRADVLSWSANRIEVAIPAEAGYGYAYVVVAGVRSTGLPVDLN